jgi:hypothetical protein
VTNDDRAALVAAAEETSIERQDSLRLPELVVLLSGLAQQLEERGAIQVDDLLVPVDEPCAARLRLARHATGYTLQLELGWSTDRRPEPAQPPGEPPAELPAGWDAWLQRLDDPSEAAGDADLPLDAGPLQVGDWVFDGVRELGRAEPVPWTVTEEGEGIAAISPVVGPEAADEAEPEPEAADEAEPEPEAADEAEPGPEAADAAEPGPAGRGAVAIGEGVTGMVPGERGPGERGPGETPAPRPDVGEPVLASGELDPAPSPPVAPPGLLAYARTAAARQALALELGVSLVELWPLLWCEELLLLPDLEPSAARLLVDCGVHGLSALARADAAALAAASGIPAAILGGWITLAQSWPPVLEP